MARTTKKRRVMRRNASRKSVRRTSPSRAMTPYRPRLKRRGSKVYASGRNRYISKGERINPRPSYMPVANPKRKRRRTVRRNPVKILNRLIPNRKLINTSLVVGTGVATGYMATPFAVYLLSLANLGDRWAGGVHLVLGALMGSMGKNRNLKDIGYIVAGMGAYDLVAGFTGGALPVLPRKVPIISGLLPGENTMGMSYGVAKAPVSRIAAAPPASAPVGASYRPELTGASYEAPGMSIEGLVGEDADCGIGHMPGIDMW